MTTSLKKNSLYRIISAVVALPVYFFTLYADYCNSFLILLASLVISLLTLYEYYTLCDRGKDGRPFIIIGMAAGVILNIAVYLYAYGGIILKDHINISGPLPIFILMTVFLAVILITQLFSRPIKGGIYSLAVTAFGVFYIVFFFSHIILMKALQDGFWYLIILNIAVMVNDTSAYFAGISIGKHKTNFPISPNKSWEGYFFGLFITIIVTAAANALISHYLNKNLFTLTESLILGILFSIFGNLGDLAESAIKRDAIQKDSGSIIPGHGGMWDVFDALIFTCPLFYYYLKFRAGI